MSDKVTYPAAGKLTEFGFEWGPVEVTRLFCMSDGMVCLRLRTKTTTVEAYVFRGGKIRMFTKRDGEVGGKEWTPPKLGRAPRRRKPR